MEIVWFFVGLCAGFALFYVIQRIMLRLALRYVKKQANAKGNAIQAQTRERTMEAFNKAIELAVAAKAEGKDNKEVLVSMLPIVFEYPDVALSLVKKLGK